MKEEWGELLTVLAESVQLYQDLLLLGEEKRQALVAANPQLLSRALKAAEK